MPRILDGAAIAAQIKEEVAAEVRALAAKDIRPGLAVVLVGHVPASEIYVRGKVQACAELGLYSELHHPARDGHHRKDAGACDPTQRPRRD